MIATLKHIAEQIAGSFKFALAVWHDARSMQAEAASKHGHLGN